MSAEELQRQFLEDADDLTVIDVGLQALLFQWKTYTVQIVLFHQTDMPTVPLMISYENMPPTTSNYEYSFFNNCKKQQRLHKTHDFIPNVKTYFIMKNIDKINQILSLVGGTIDVRGNTFYRYKYEGKAVFGISIMENAGTVTVSRVLPSLNAPCKRHLYNLCFGKVYELWKSKTLFADCRLSNFIINYNPFKIHVVNIESPIEGVPQDKSFESFKQSLKTTQEALIWLIKERKGQYNWYDDIKENDLSHTDVQSECFDVFADFEQLKGSEQPHFEQLKGSEQPHFEQLKGSEQPIAHYDDLEKNKTRTTFQYLGHMMKARGTQRAIELRGCIQKRKEGKPQTPRCNDLFNKYGESYFQAWKSGGTRRKARKAKRRAKRSRR